MPNFIEKRIANYVKNIYTLKLKITPNPTMPLYNQRCHLNALEAVSRDLAKGIIECVVITPTNEPITHYINVTSDGNYLDYTFGNCYINYDYHFVRVVDSSEYGDMSKVLKDAKVKLLKSVVPSWLVTLGILPKYEFS